MFKMKNEKIDFLIVIYRLYKKNKYKKYEES